MKKLLVVLLFFPETILAVTTISYTNPLLTTDFVVLADNIINILFTISLPLAVVLTIFGGILIVTAAGDEKRVEIGKKCITYTIIGLILIIMSKGILSLLNYLLS